MKKTALFNCTQPCGNCPYRTDAPLQLWDQIIDPTASQFKTPTGEDMPEVYIGEKPDWYKQ